MHWLLRNACLLSAAQILVLGWCVSQRDMEVVRKVVQQVCVAHAPEGGTTVGPWQCEVLSGCLAVLASDAQRATH